MRPRDLALLESTPRDVLVVGGGIQGLAVAYECASRGLSLSLVEAGDFGSGASFNHQKTAHGGLRALSTGQLEHAREAIRERRALARIAPRFLRPLPFLVGTYRSIVKNRVAMAAAFRFDAWLGRHRNEGLEPELHLPAPRLVSRAATLALFPGIKRENLTGGAQWYDYQMVESDRLTIAFAEAADQAGAALANYVTAIGPLREGGHIVGMSVRDVLGGRTFEARARVTVNAAGSRAGEIMRGFGVDRPFPLLKAMNVVTSKPAADMALAAPTRSGRMLTLTPWRGRAIVGTAQSNQLVQPGDVTVTSHELDAFIREANDAFPALSLTRGDVRLVHRGVVPASNDRDGRTDLKSRPDILDHATEGAAGAITVVGVKYTTARGVAERVASAVAQRLGRTLQPSRTEVTMLPGAGIADHEALAIEAMRASGVEIPSPILQHLIALYGETAPELVRLIADRPELGEPVSPGVRTIAAEIVHVIRTEMAVRLGDIVIRRTGLGSAGHPGEGAVARSADIAAVELGWTAAERQAEIDAVAHFYRTG